jgi:hypothetical protein
MEGSEACFIAITAVASLLAIRRSGDQSKVQYGGDGKWGIGADCGARVSRPAAIARGKIHFPTGANWRIKSAFNNHRACHDEKSSILLVHHRRATLLWIGILYLVSAVWSTFATDVTTFSIARFIGGLGVGISTVAAPLYITEIAPRIFEWTGTKGVPLEELQRRLGTA